MATVPDFAGSSTLTSAALNNFVHEVTGSGGTGITNANVAADAAIAISKTALGTYTAWTTWSPTLSAASGTWGTITSSNYKYCQIGKTVFFMFFALGTTSNSTTALTFTLPITPVSITTNFLGGGAIIQYQNTVLGGMWQYQQAAAKVYVYLYGGEGASWTASSGNGCTVMGHYDVA
jgi:hypothetical protein